MRIRRRASTEPQLVELAVVGSGLVAHGFPSALAAFADTVREITRDRGRLRTVVADGLAVAESIYAHRKTHREYFEFSPRALELLREHGAIPTGDGWFHSLVRSGERIVGNVEWRQVDLVADQALSMQTAAASLALRAAIRDVADAVARVEGKVDKLVTLARAERLGSVMGDQRTLAPLVEQARTLGTINDTDWSTVALLGPLMARDIEALRDCVRREIHEAEQRRFGRPRSAELEVLTDDLIGESLALLVLAEENYSMWEEVRLARIATAERAVLGSAISDTRSRLRELQVADQSLIDSLAATAQELLEPTGYEGFRPIARSRLQRLGEDVARSVDWFAAQRHLDTDPLDLEYPSLRDSVARTARAASEKFGRLRPGPGNDSGEEEANS